MVPMRNLYFIFHGFVYYCILSTVGAAEHLSALDDAFRQALTLRDQHKESRNENDSQMNENKNQGLINTIINHNNKLKHIENKFNLMINNFANSSHVKEIVEKNSELESFIYGPPQPHRSWRELLLIVVVPSLFLLLLFKLVQKYVGPRLILHLGKQLSKDNKERMKISEQPNHQPHEAVITVSNLLAALEEKMGEQSREIKNIHRSLQRNNEATTDRIPTRV